MYSATSLFVCHPGHNPIHVAVVVACNCCSGAYETPGVLAGRAAVAAQAAKAAKGAQAPAAHARAAEAAAAAAQALDAVLLRDTAVAVAATAAAADDDAESDRPPQRMRMSNAAVVVDETHRKEVYSTPTKNATQP